MFSHPEQENTHMDEAASAQTDYTRFSDFHPHVDMVRQFLLEKKDFLDKLWVEKRDYCVAVVKNDVPFLNQDYNQTLYYWVEKGKPIEGLPHYEAEGYDFIGYFNLENGKRIEDGTMIFEDCVVEGKWEETGGQ